MRRPDGIASAKLADWHQLQMAPFPDRRRHWMRNGQAWRGVRSNSEMPPNNKKEKKVDASRPCLGDDAGRPERALQRSKTGTECPIWPAIPPLVDHQSPAPGLGQRSEARIGDNRGQTLGSKRSGAACSLSAISASETPVRLS